MIEKIAIAQYIGKAQFKGLKRDKSYELFITEQKRGGFLLEVLINSKIGYKNNLLIPYSNIKSINDNWKFKESE